MQDYERVDHTVECHSAMTEEEFREIETAYGKPLGRFKEWSEHFVFGELDAGQAARVLDVLKRGQHPHTMDVTWKWAPDA